MLTARGAKRDRTNRFKLGMLWDIFDDANLVGRLACDMGASQASLTVKDKSYTIETTATEQDGPMAELLHQHTEGRTKRGSKTLALKDANGHTLGLAKEAKPGFVVANKGNAYVLRKASLFSPQYNVCLADSEKLAGSVGQKSLFSRALHMDLPAEFDAACQVFLLLLSLNLAAERAASLNP